MGIYAKVVSFKIADGSEVASIATSADKQTDDMIFFDVDHSESLIIVDGRIEVSSTVTPLDNTLFLAQIDLCHAGFLDKKAGFASQKEKDSWGIKVTIAEKLLDNLQLSVSEDAYLSSANIPDRKIWAGKVIGKSVDYFSANGMADSLRKKQKTALLDIKNKDERDALMVSIYDDWANLGA